MSPILFVVGQYCKERVAASATPSFPTNSTSATLSREGDAPAEPEVSTTAKLGSLALPEFGKRYTEAGRAVLHSSQRRCPAAAPSVSILRIHRAIRKRGPQRGDLILRHVLAADGKTPETA